MRTAYAVIPLLLVWGCTDRDALDEALAKLKDPRDAARGDAVWELQEFRDPRAARALTEALKDKSAHVRLSAAMVLADSDGDGPELLAALSRASHDCDPQVRRWVIMAMGRMADPAALPVLHQAITDPEADVRRDAVQAIHKIDAALQARSVRYHPPATVPLVLSPEDSKIYLRAHEEEWSYVVSRVSELEMAGPSLSITVGTICEAPEIVTKGAYLGQSDAVAFLDALHHRMKRDPRALEEFRALRTELLKLHPLPKESDLEK
jgi:hypothetical protein